MNHTMQAISQDELGGPEVLKPTTVQRPEPGMGEVLVRVHAASVNPVDGMNRQTGMFVGQPPFVLGWDLAGTVEVTGPGVTIHRPGDAVFGMLPFPHGHGAHAQYAVGPARAFVPKPDCLDHVQAAALPLSGLTAWQALVDTARIGEGSRVLVNGASGGVGHLAVQIAKAHGAYVIGVASTANTDFVRTLGADEVIDYTTTDITQATDNLDVVLETVGGDYPVKALEVLKPDGILVSTLPQTLAAIEDDARERGVRLAGLFVEADGAGMTALAELTITGQLTPTITATFPLEQAATAQSTKSGPGKTVLTLA
ncbi:NADP-dependent oxidoreductase [Kocuria sp. CPCC 205263]|uniref:NADP-dependent oxidoreductase n=1 Tax=Kocuria sp. CPCC 205263 TaxID=3073555 RepID=UPI0034D69667